MPDDAYEYQVRKALNDAAYTGLAYVPYCSTMPVPPRCEAPKFAWVSFFFFSSFLSSRLETAPPRSAFPHTGPTRPALFPSSTRAEEKGVAPLSCVPHGVLLQGRVASAPTPPPPSTTTPSPSTPRSRPTAPAVRPALATRASRRARKAAARPTYRPAAACRLAAVAARAAV